MDDFLISLAWAAVLVAIVIAVFVITAHVRLWLWRRRIRRVLDRTPTVSKR